MGLAEDEQATQRVSVGFKAAERKNSNSLTKLIPLQPPLKKAGPSWLCLLGESIHILRSEVSFDVCLRVVHIFGHVLSELQGKAPVSIPQFIHKPKTLSLLSLKLSWHNSHSLIFHLSLSRSIQAGTSIAKRMDWIAH
jgi:hypothetical protein